MFNVEERINIILYIFHVKSKKEDEEIDDTLTIKRLTLLTKVREGSMLLKSSVSVIKLR